MILYISEGRGVDRIDLADKLDVIGTDKERSRITPRFLT